LGIAISGVSEINSTQKQEDTAEQRNKSEKPDLSVRHLSNMKKSLTPLLWIEKGHEAFEDEEQPEGYQ
jgi:hypothetical protein